MSNLRYCRTVLLILQYCLRWNMVLSRHSNTCLYHLTCNISINISRNFVILVGLVLLVVLIDNIILLDEQHMLICSRHLCIMENNLFQG